MCVSVFRVTVVVRAFTPEEMASLAFAASSCPLTGATPGVRHKSLRVEHICDIGCEQLGTGVVKPSRGLWSWLGIDCTKEGDILVGDSENDCVRLL